MLEAHDWPGNVRELRHRIEAAALLGDGDEIAPDDLGLGEGRCDPTPGAGAIAAAMGLEHELWRLVADRGMSLAQVSATCEEMLVRAALRAEGDNRTRAAARLGINVRTIYKKLPR